MNFDDYPVIKKKVIVEGNQMIYFIQSLDMIKVGYTTNINERSKALMVGNPHGLIVIGTVKGIKEHETMIHNKLAKYRVSGEWFKNCEFVRRYINDLLNRKIKLKYKAMVGMHSNTRTVYVEDRKYITGEAEWLGSWREIHDIRTTDLCKISKKVRKIEIDINKLVGKKKVLEERYMKLVKGRIF